MTAPDPSDRLIAAHCRATLRQLIDEYNGCEVFAIGTIGDDGAVQELDPLAFGNWDAVPAPAQNARPGQVLIHNHPSGGTQPSNADIDIASAYGKAGIGFYIVDNAVRDIRVVVKPFRETKLIPVDPDALDREFHPGGRLAGSIGNYEFRPQQVEMMRLVARAFNDDRIAVVEAGTGTGKSYAYLVPAITWALANKRRVVVSTGTITLQEQLLRKDIPELCRKMGLEARAVLVKGRSNYISLRRLEFASRQRELIPGDRSREIAQLAEWARRTRDGSKADLAFEPSPEVWEAVASDKDDCLRARCPHFNECFFYRSRREAAAADIVVANHHLVMADIALKKDHTGNDFAAILPPFDRIVFDEAHHIEEVATEYFSSATSELAISRQLAKLDSPRDGYGALTRLLNGVYAQDSAELYPSTPQILRLLRGELPERRMELDAIIDECFRELFTATVAYFGLGNMSHRERRELRITDQVAESDYWKDATLALERIADAIGAYLKPVDKALELLRFYPDQVRDELADTAMSALGAAAKVAAHRQAITFFVKAGADHCRWLEVGFFRDRPVVRPCAAPLDMAPALRDALFSRKKTIVLTSATLAVEGRFDFVRGQLGLSLPSAGETDTVPERCDTLLLGSPFDYRRCCMVGVPVDAPSPASPEFEDGVTDLIFETLSLTGGRAFVLFTSYRSLEKLYRLLRERLVRAGITPIRQGEMPRGRLLDAFRSTPRSALFATSSFWEGVDVQGRALECLVLTKLPFRVPSTPILEARTEKIDRAGGDSFRELSMPLAVIRFKQGFGRLIRSRNDRGLVLVLDHRLVTKPYGRTFLRSLPPARVVQDPATRILDEFRRFYNPTP